MGRYLLRKVSWAVGSLAFVIVLNFFLFRILPGDPAQAGVRDPRLTAEVQQRLRERFGVDKPVFNCFETLNPLKPGDCFVNPLETQFVIYIGNLLQGELGTSYRENRPVTTLLAERLWNTLLLVVPGQIISIVLGISLGVVAAWKSRTRLDYTILIGSLIAWSLPTFWLGIMFVIWGSEWFGLPVAGRETPGADFATPWDAWLDTLRHMILPTLTLVIVYLGQYMLIMRSTVLDVFSEDYILTAKAKGLSTGQILRDHAMRNAMLPMITIIALNLSFTVGGAIQVETVFSWPGLGQTIFTAVGQRDYPVLQGAFLLIAVTVIVANLLADLLYSVLDPRVQTGAAR